ncbi:MAG: leucyl/phenylalanyl-tRNA--protein transferase [Pyrinomonadaceae bacterium]|nr:leucyl/phenylalanyl-tRNA--protein transferase [Phycisphaerales bacterium]
MSDQDHEIVSGLLQAYRAGIFPMADPDTGVIDWYSPDPRSLMPISIYPDHQGRCFHVSRSLARRLRSGHLVLTTDAAFTSVIRSCAEPREERPDSWIDERIIHAFTLLHHAGHAHSIEAWLPAGPLSVAAAAPSRPAQAYGRRRSDMHRRWTRSQHDSRSVTPVLSHDGLHVLVGGIYGVSIGSAFFAESMFCRPELGHRPGADGQAGNSPGTDASKVCLFHLVSHLHARGYTVMDVQLRNSHTDQFGVYTVTRDTYLEMLAASCDRPTSWLPFDPARHVVPTRSP